MFNFNHFARGLCIKYRQILLFFSPFSPFSRSNSLSPLHAACWQKNFIIGFIRRARVSPSLWNFHHIWRMCNILFTCDLPERPDAAPVTSLLTDGPRWEMSWELGHFHIASMSPYCGEGGWLSCSPKPWVFFFEFLHEIPQIERATDNTAYTLKIIIMVFLILCDDGSHFNDLEGLT